jgi:excisionase family DNA binding protein
MTLSDLTDRATITMDEAAGVLGVSRASAYEAVRRGQIPSLRLGRRVLVPVPQLLELLRGGQQ